MILQNQTKLYQLPDNPRQAPRVFVRALGYVAGLLFCCPVWALIGYAAGCHVGWLGQ